MRVRERSFGGARGGFTRPGGGFVAPSSQRLVARADFDRPAARFVALSTAAALASQLGIGAAVATEVFPCQEADGTTLTGSAGTILTSEDATKHRTGGIALGLHDGNGSLASFRGADVSRHVANSGFAAANVNVFDKTNASVAVLLLVRHHGAHGAVSSLLGKWTTGVNRGWGMEWDLGTPQILAGDGTGTVITVTEANAINDGDWHFVVGILNRTTGRAVVITDRGRSQSAATSLLTMGSITSPAATFRLGTRGTVAAAGFQCAGWAIFDGAAAEALDDQAALNAWWERMHGAATNTLAGYTYTRAAVAGAPGPDWGLGESNLTWSSGRVAYGYGANLPGTKLGLLCCPSYTNWLIYTDLANASGWSAQSAPTVTQAVGLDPRGVRTATRVQKTVAASRLRSVSQYNINAGSTFVFSVWYRSSASLPEIRWRDSADAVTNATATATIADGKWRRLSVAFTGGGGNHYVDILPSASGLAAGDCEFACPMITTAISGTEVPPWVHTNGGSAATALVSCYRDQAFPGIGRRGAMRAVVQMLTDGSRARIFAALVNAASASQRASIVSISGAGNNAPNVALTNDAAGVLADVSAPAIAGGQFTSATNFIGQWDAGGIGGGANEASVRGPGASQTGGSVASWTRSDPNRLWVGSSGGLSSPYSLVQRVDVFARPMEAA